jgi:hypothetical protein
MARSEVSPLTGSEVECPRCGTVAVNSDFCSCGEYLGWDVPEPAEGPEPGDQERGEDEQQQGEKS